MAFYRGFQTKCFLKPWCMHCNPVKVLFKVFSIFAQRAVSRLNSKSSKNPWVQMNPLNPLIRGQCVMYLNETQKDIQWCFKLHHILSMLNRMIECFFKIFFRACLDVYHFTQTKNRKLPWHKVNGTYNSTCMEYRIKQNRAGYKIKTWKDASTQSSNKVCWSLEILQQTI